MSKEKKIDIKDLPFVYMEEGMCVYCNRKLSTIKINGKFICYNCRFKLPQVLYYTSYYIPKFDAVIKVC